MDRVKGLRRATAAVFLVVACALVLSCSADNSVLSGRSTTYDSPGDIYGYVTGPYGAIEGATVAWECYNDSSALGSDITDGNGYYNITAAAWWTNHTGHRFIGTATKTGYQPDEEEIPSYNPNKDYQVVFYLEP